MHYIYIGLRISLFVSAIMALISYGCIAPEEDPSTWVDAWERSESWADDVEAAAKAVDENKKKGDEDVVEEEKEEDKVDGNEVVVVEENEKETGGGNEDVFEEKGKEEKMEVVSVEDETDYSGKDHDEPWEDRCEDYRPCMQKYKEQWKLPYDMMSKTQKRNYRRSVGDVFLRDDPNSSFRKNKMTEADRRTVRRARQRQNEEYVAKRAQDDKTEVVLNVLQAKTKAASAACASSDPMTCTVTPAKACTPKVSAPPSKACMPKSKARGSKEKVVIAGAMTVKGSAARQVRMDIDRKEKWGKGKNKKDEWEKGKNETDEWDKGKIRKMNGQMTMVKHMDIGKTKSMQQNGHNGHRLMPTPTTGIHGLPTRKHGRLRPHPAHTMPPLPLLILFPGLGKSPR